MIATPHSLKHYAQTLQRLRWRLTLLHQKFSLTAHKPLAAHRISQGDVAMDDNTIDVDMGLGIMTPRGLKAADGDDHDVEMGVNSAKFRGICNNSGKWNAF